jgi:mannose-6-phosphate isomerase-like protein (cupin superfamily)
MRIADGDTVRFALLAGPEEANGATVVFEIWEPGGAQPPNSHSASTEWFLFLAGTGRAHCDDHVTDVAPGELLVLPPGSTHHIENTGPGRLYAITTMVPDDGFADLVRTGASAPLDADDLAVLAGGLSAEVTG